MARPHRARTIALAFTAGGIVASIAPFVLPAPVAGDTARLVGGRLSLRPLGRLRLKGVPDGVDAYELRERYTG